MVAKLFREPPAIQTVFCLERIECEVIVYRLEDTDSARFGLRFVLARLKTLRATFRVGNAQQQGALATAFEEQSRPDDAILVNGGFFTRNHDERLRPFGLVISDGRRVSPLNGWKNGGVLFSTNSTNKIVAVRDFEGAGVYDHAIQSRPMLVEAGRQGIRSDDRRLFDRTAVAIDEDGSPIAAGVFSDDGFGVSLFEFGALLVEGSSRHALHLRAALNMDGGPSAHIYIPRAKLHFGAPSITYLPAFVAILAR